MRNLEAVLGVTLLEIMLVLAIAAMIIVMSVRYYQSATANQQANAALQMILGISSAADSLAQATNSYQSVSTSSIKSLMPNRSMTTPWGSQIRIVDADKTAYGVVLDATPVAVCVLLRSYLGNDYTAQKSKYAIDQSTHCNSFGPFIYYYYSTPP